MSQQNFLTNTPQRHSVTAVVSPSLFRSFAKWGSVRRLARRDLGWGKQPLIPEGETEGDAALK